MPPRNLDLVIRIIQAKIVVIENTRLSRDVRKRALNQLDQLYLLAVEGSTKRRSLKKRLKDIMEELKKWFGF